MEISKQLSRNIYIMFSICFGSGNYLYITKYVGGDVFIGVCAFAVTGIFALMLYNNTSLKFDCIRQNLEHKKTTG